MEYAFLFVPIGFAIGFIAAAFAIYTGVRKRVRPHPTTFEVDTARAALQQQIQLEILRSTEVEGSPSRLARWAAGYTRLNPELAGPAQVLRKRLSKVPEELVCKDDQYRIMLGRATLANAESSYRAALNLVPDTDEPKTTRLPKPRLEKIIREQRIRGDAFLGMRRWKEACACYRRILQLEPRDWQTRQLVAICLWCLNDRTEAIRHLSAVIDHYKRVADRSSEPEPMRDLAIGLNNRSVMYFVGGSPNEAVRNFEKAVDLHHRLARQSAASSRLDLARVYCNRATALRLRGSMAAAIDDFRQAKTLFARLVDQQGRHDLRENQARALAQFGEVLVEHGAMTDAITEFTQAIGRYTVLVDKGRTPLAPDLARARKGRGTAHAAQQRWQEALQDFSAAIGIYAPLVEEDGRQDLAYDYATALQQEAKVLLQQGNAQRALIDLDNAIHLLSHLAESNKQEESLEDLAAAHEQRAHARLRLGEVSEALPDLDKTIELLTHLVAQTNREDLAKQLAGAHHLRGGLLIKQEQVEKGLSDLNDSVQIFARLVEWEGRSELSRDLARALCHRGTTLHHLERFPEAIRDFDGSTEIYARLVDREGIKELLDDLGRALLGRALAHAAHGNAQAAIVDLTRVEQSDCSSDVRDKARNKLNNLRGEKVI